MRTQDGAQLAFHHPRSRARQKRVERLRESCGIPRIEQPGYGRFSYDQRWRETLRRSGRAATGLRRTLNVGSDRAGAQTDRFHRGRDHDDRQDRGHKADSSAERPSQSVLLTTARHFHFRSPPHAIRRRLRRPHPPAGLTKIFAPCPTLVKSEIRLIQGGSGLPLVSGANGRISSPTT